MVHPSCGSCAGCKLGIPRRGFLGGIGAAALAGSLERASSLFAAPSPPAGKARVEVIFVRPAQEPIVSWPGGNADVPGQQALFTRTLREAAAELNVDLAVRDEPVKTMEEAGAFLERLRQSPPDGLLIGAMSLMTWKPVNEIVEKRGDIPTIVYSHLTGFTSNLQCGRNTPRTFLAATHDVKWLSCGLRMFHALWRAKNTRILVLSKAGPDSTIAPWGTVWHSIDKVRFEQAFREVQDSDEIRSIASSYAKGAERIVEPTRQEILDAAKNYIVCRRLMNAEKCQGISIACLGWTNPVCLSFSKLLDEGIVAGCEADPNPALSQLLAINLLNKPGFIQDPSPNTVNNTLIGSHCTSALRLEGYASSYRAPYWLRSYHTRTGASLEVMWPVGRPVTVFEAFAKTGSMIVGTGRVRGNIPQPPSGCCRTAVEIELDNVADTRDVKGFHQLFLLGHEERTIRAFGQLAGVPVDRLA
jgi:hypothetical protein